MSSWHLFRDGGRWSGYEGTNEHPTALETRAGLEGMIRKLQAQDVANAREALEIARKKVADAEAELAAPVRIRLLGEGRK